MGTGAVASIPTTEAMHLESNYFSGVSQALKSADPTTENGQQDASTSPRIVNEPLNPTD
jgi:hypothetical protein